MRVKEIVAVRASVDGVGVAVRRIAAAGGSFREGDRRVV